MTTEKGSIFLEARSDVGGKEDQQVNRLKVPARAYLF